MAATPSVTLRVSVFSHHCTVIQVRTVGQSEAARQGMGEIEIRVRYAETDQMGFLHHAHYLVYFEMGRVELLRSRGLNYKDIEAQGFFLVIAKAQVRYHKPARYDDLLKLRTQVLRTTGARIDHRYELRRDSELIAEGETTLACVDRAGRLQRLPEMLRKEES